MTGPLRRRYCVIPVNRREALLWGLVWIGTFSKESPDRPACTIVSTV